jgi:hypothetical protein
MEKKFSNVFAKLSLEEAKVEVEANPEDREDQETVSY